jgi:hypothetical protein
MYHYIYISLYFYVQCLHHVPQKMTQHSSALYAFLKAPKINNAFLLYSTSVAVCELNTVRSLRGTNFAFPRNLDLEMLM